MPLPTPEARAPFAEYPHSAVVATRWSDNDMYGHLNNAVYYELFDTLINEWTARHTGPDFASAEVIGVVAESSCRFFSELRFPDPVTLALRVLKVGRSSVVYELGAFAGADPAPADVPAAVGSWVHVYVRRHESGSVPIPGPLRSALESLTG